MMSHNGRYKNVKIQPKFENHSKKYLREKSNYEIFDRSYKTPKTKAIYNYTISISFHR